MTTETAGLRVDHILECVPFSFVLDTDGNVVRVGRYLADHYPEILGKRFDDAFTLVQGARAIECLLFGRADERDAIVQERIELDLTPAGGLGLIGTLLPLEAGKGGVFIGTIAPSLIAKVTQLGLTMSDFAPFDVAADLAMMAQVNDAALKDMRVLNEKLMVARDQAVAARKKVEAIALVDALSGLGNRAAFQRVEAQDAVGGDCDAAPVSSLLLIDLDNFKPINDHYGHATGDELIRWVGNAIRETVKGRAEPFRLGGDEFAVVFTGPTPHQAVQIATELQQAINRSFIVGGRSVAIRASAGLASRMFGINDLEGLYRAADIALHDAKRSGRAKLQLFTAKLGQQELENKLLERDLIEAVESDDDLQVWVQPLFDLQSGELWGGEALVRWWNRRLERFVPPSVFVPIAEQYGLVSKIDLLVFSRIVSQRHLAGGRACQISWSTNFSPLTIQRLDLRQKLRAILRKQRPLCVPLTIEITEGAISTDPERIAVTLRAIRDMGLELAMDDFGAGQTSLAQLTSLPITRLKLDRSLVEKIDNDERAEMIALSIVKLAHELGLRVTAEGIERRSQVERLARMGPMKAQGFLFAHPMPLQEFTEYVEANESCVCRAAMN